MDASALPAAIGVVEDGTVSAEQRLPAGIDTGSALADALAKLHSHIAGRVDRCAVVTGPGSFTGIRASLALARGYGDAASLPVIGVPLDVAFAPLRESEGGRLVVAAHARPGVFHVHDGTFWHTCEEADPPDLPQGLLALSGNAAPVLAARLAARERPLKLLDWRRPALAWIAAGAAAKTPPVPFYGEAPRARALLPRPAPTA